LDFLKSDCEVLGTADDLIELIVDEFDLSQEFDYARLLFELDCFEAGDSELFA
jgi:hypothetical protein